MLRSIIIVNLIFIFASSACSVGISTSAAIVSQTALIPANTIRPTRTQPTFPTITPQVNHTHILDGPTSTHKPTLTHTVTPIPVAEPPAGITYRTDIGLYVTDGLGNAKLLFAHGPHEIADVSPDAAAVLLYDFKNQHIVDLETGSQTQIWPRDDYNLCPFAWVKQPSPVMLISVLLSEGAEPGYSCNRGSPVLLTLGGEITIFDQAGTGYSAPDVSSDGALIAFDLAGNPWLYDWQNGAKQFDVLSFGFPASDQVAFSDPAWSPSGNKLAWTYWTRETPEDISQSGIAVFDFETHTSTLLTPYYVIGYEGSRTNIEWNAEETYISVWHFEPDAEIFNSEMLAIDGSFARTLAGLFDQWSPVDNIFTIEKNTGSWELYIESPDGSISMSVCCGIYNVRWSPDGKSLLSKSRDDNFWVMDLETGASVQINLPADAEIVSWIADE